MKPVLEIYGDAPRRYFVDSLVVTQQEYMHDQFSAYLSRPGPISDIKGVPCSVTWGSGIGANTMYGYVDTIGSMSGDTGLTGSAVIGLAPSSHMRSGTARTWRRTSPFNIAKSIVGPYRIGVVADRYVQSLDSFLQSGDSDWATLVRLATTVGMTLIGGGGTVVRMLDVRSAVGRALLRPVINLSNPDSFSIIDTPSPYGYDSYEFSGVDRLGAPFSVKGGRPDGVKRHPGENFTSLEDALAAARRHEDRDRHLTRAMATFNGQARVRCGDVVMVEGGYWFVASCKQEISIGSTNMTTRVELHKPLLRRPTTAFAPAAPSTRLVSNTWVSSRRYEVEL